MVPVNLSGATNVVAAQFDLVFASTNVATGDAVAGPALADHVVTTGGPAAGTVRLVIHSPTNASLGTGIVANLPVPFAANAAPGSIRIGVSNVLLSDIDGVAVTNIALRPGSVSCGTSAPVTPMMTVQPASQATLAGGTLVLEAGAIATQSPAYQWYFNGTNRIAGATDTVLVLTNFQQAQEGAYTVVASTSFAGVT